MFWVTRMVHCDEKAGKDKIIIQESDNTFEQLRFKFNRHRNTKHTNVAFTCSRTNLCLMMLLLVTLKGKFRVFRL